MHVGRLSRHHCHFTARRYRFDSLIWRSGAFCWEFCTFSSCLCGFSSLRFPFSQICLWILWTLFIPSYASPLFQNEWWLKMQWNNNNIHLYVFFLLTAKCYNDKGRFYQGTYNVTASGIPCQRWDKQVNMCFLFTNTWRRLLLNKTGELNVFMLVI